MDELIQLVEQRQRLKAEIAVAEAHIKDNLDPQILIALSVAGIKSTTVEALGKKWSTYIMTSTGKVSYPVMKLVSAGVTPEQLKKAETTSKGSTSIVVKEITAQEQEQEIPA